MLGSLSVNELLLSLSLLLFLLARKQPFILLLPCISTVDNSIFFMLFSRLVYFDYKSLESEGVICVVLLHLFKVKLPNYKSTIAGQNKSVPCALHYFS